MTIVLTGANGQVGYEINRIARETAINIHSLDRVSCDISRAESIDSAFANIQNPSVIINAAAYTAVDKAETEKDAAYAINRDGSRYLARKAADLGIPIIHLSTDYVFSGDAHHPYVESDQVAPLNVYGASKLDGELEVIKSNSSHILLRTSWVFGGHGNNFVRTMLRLARERTELSIVNDQIGCPTCAVDIAATVLSIVKAISSGNTAWGIYHYCGTPPVSWYQFATEIFKILQDKGAAIPKLKAINTEQYPLPARRPAYSVLDCTKIADKFGIRQPDWLPGVRQSIESLSRLI